VVPDLLLEVERRGRDDDLLAAQGRRDEVGERLSRAGSGFDEERAIVQERVLDRFGHRHLAVARLVPCEHPGAEGSRAEDVDGAKHTSLLLGNSRGSEGPSTIDSW